MSTNKPAIYSAFEKDFWKGLELWCDVNHEIQLREGADAKDWDGVKRAEGARQIISKLRRLQGEYEAFVATNNIGAP